MLIKQEFGNKYNWQMNQDEIIQIFWLEAWITKKFQCQKLF